MLDRAHEIVVLDLILKCSDPMGYEDMLGNSRLLCLTNLGLHNYIVLITTPM